MTSSISAWSGDIYGISTASAKRSELQKSESFDLWQMDRSVGASVEIMPMDEALAAGNNVQAIVVAGELGFDAPAQMGGGAQASAAAGEDDDKTEVYYRTVVLPDGSKLMQVITKYPDGSIKSTTARLPGNGDDESEFHKELVKAVDRGEDKSGGEDLLETSEAV